MTRKEILSLGLAVGASALVWFLERKINRSTSGVGGFPGGYDHMLPTVVEYSKLLDIAQNKFGISREQARKKYGLYTVGQWKKLLGIGKVNSLAVLDKGLIDTVRSHFDPDEIDYVANKMFMEREPLYRVAPDMYDSIYDIAHDWLEENGYDLENDIFERISPEDIFMEL